ncbi:PIN domain-containing protein [Candidatus Woesearchaeota archaeon]|nr:PIN domain-containing protein [Candidatus Woesearchaeota archaeon]
MLYVADTHSLIWFLTDDRRLGKHAREVFNETDSGKAVILIPTIVLAELIFICEKKDAAVPFKHILNKINQSSNYVTYSLDMRLILEISNLRLSEMHDRIIVATAYAHKATLITKDREIRKSRLVNTIWN